MIYKNTIITLMTIFSLMSIGWGQDITPPLLTYFSITPSELDITTPSTVTLTIEVFEESSTMCSSNISIGSYSHGFSMGSIDGMNFSNQLSFNIDQVDFPDIGTYPIQVHLTDCSGNSISYTSGDLELLGFTNEVVIEFEDSTLCDEGYVNIDYIPWNVWVVDSSECFYQSDLDVLQVLVDESHETINMEMDYNNNGVIEPLELCIQEWRDGRLILLDNHEFPSGLVSDLPPELGSLSQLERFISQYIYDEYGSGYYDNLPPPITSLPEEIGNLTNLTSLVLDGNQISTIPNGLWNLYNLVELDLSRNQISGEIPPEISNLTNLNFLFLSENQLSGEIPSIIGELPNLDYFDLSYNQLSGFIPVEICTSPTLSSFYLDFNQLCPPYPECFSGSIDNQDTLDCPEYLIGDGNFDGFVDVRDIVLGVELIIYSYDEMDMYQLYVFDLNQDGQFNVVDLVELVMLIIDE
ncbi:MAG: hypothetical protein CBD21_05165 [bacterium TMED161]|nr:MAG: hypothetical protein CBD21_05165 [bacterium TMED161]